MNNTWIHDQEFPQLLIQLDNIMFRSIYYSLNFSANIIDKIKSNKRVLSTVVISAMPSQLIIDGWRHECQREIWPTSACWSFRWTVIAVFHSGRFQIASPTVGRQQESKNNNSRTDHYETTIRKTCISSWAALTSRDLASWLLAHQCKTQVVLSIRNDFGSQV